MDIRGWDERYRESARSQAGVEAFPATLVVETVKHLQPGRALDLACGTGGNALWLVREGWKVTAIDGSAAAIELLRKEARRQGAKVEARVADLKDDYRMEGESWDLIVMAYYLQRDLFETAKRGLTPGGVLIAIVHTTVDEEEPTESRLRPGELNSYFAGWEIAHWYEGQPRDSAHRRRAAEVVARKPPRGS